VCETLNDQPKVLVIDDEEAARFGVARALSQGYRVQEAEDGLKALAAIDSFQPDVIVSDINMPGMDGISLLKHVNQGAEPPLVVLITAYGSEQMAIEALRAGAHNYLAKPFELEELRLVVAGAVDKQRLIRQNRHYLKELERTLTELKESQAARVQAEKLASLGRLVAGVAHEINNPLGVLHSGCGILEVAARRIGEWCGNQPADTTSQVKEFLEVLTATASRSKAACERIHAVVTNLRQFAQLDRADMQRAQIHDGLVSTLRLLRHELDRQADVVCELGELPEVDCNPRALNQLLMNLLLNAMDAIRLTGRRGLIRIRTWRDGESVKIEIADNGVGIPPENLSKIFDPGFTTKGVRVGTGLGLPICLQIARSHRGRIDVSSRPGAATVFTVTLPLRAAG